MYLCISTDTCVCVFISSLRTHTYVITYVTYVCVCAPNTSSHSSKHIYHCDRLLLSRLDYHLTERKGVRDPKERQN